MKAAKFVPYYGLLFLVSLIVMGALLFFIPEWFWLALPAVCTTFVKMFDMI